MPPARRGSGALLHARGRASSGRGQCIHLPGGTQKGRPPFRRTGRPVVVRRYLVRETGGTLLAVLAVLLLVYGASRFVRLVAEAAAGRLPGDVVFPLVFVKLVVGLPVLLPLAFFIAVLLALGRLYRDSEVVALAAGGIGIPRLAQMVMPLAALVAVIVAALSCIVSPRLASLEESLTAHARGEAQVTSLLPGSFSEFGDGGVVYVETVDEDRRIMRNVFVRIARPDRDEVVTARRAYQSVQGPGDERFMVLEDGYRHAGRPGRADFVTTRFERHAVRLDAVVRSARHSSIDAVLTSELWRSPESVHAAELQWRLSLPVTAGLLALLAVPLARTGRRQGRYAKLLVAVVLYFIYSNSLGITRNLVERGELSAWIGLWPVHLVMLGVAVAMLKRQGGRHRYRIVPRGGGAGFMAG